MVCIGTAMLNRSSWYPANNTCPGGCQTHVIPLTEISGFLNKFLNHILKFATLLLSAWYH